MSSHAILFNKFQYLLIALLWFIFGYFLYILSVPVAKTLGLLIRSSFDLYRFDLLKQLNHPIPKSLKQERKAWQKLSDFFVTGGSLGVLPLEFDYNLKPEFRDEAPKPRKGIFSRIFCRN